MITLVTETGKLTLKKSVIEELVMEVIDQYTGIVFVSASRAKLPVIKKGKTEEITDIKINFSEKGLDIRVDVMIKFGTSISETTEKLISGIREKVSEITGITCNSVTIVVTGMVAKKIAPRYIEVTG